jgi:hypothetical protein
MTFDTAWYSGDCDFRSSPLSVRPQRLMGAAALACVALACTYTLGVSIFGSTGLTEVTGTRGDKLDLAAGRGDRLVALRREAPAALGAVIAWFDPHSLRAPPGSFGRNAPSDVAVQTAQGDASPAVSGRAAQSTPTSPPVRTAALHERKSVERVPAHDTADAPTIFERLFGGPSPLTLAYAAPNDGGLGGTSATAGLYDRETAVYDISARVVYMPDGTRLEAHSGLGSLLDDPHHADAKDRGVTPPNIYDLKLREALFHGVRALRLVPEDEGKVYGRSGLLAHSFMLGPNGDSNGCVSFRNYEAFLRAYLDQKIKRLAVVAHLE